MGHLAADATFTEEWTRAAVRSTDGILAGLDLAPRSGRVLVLDPAR